MAIRRIRKFNLLTEIALDRYLLSRLKLAGAIFGITNVAILLACLWYVFFVLPQSALEQARVTVAGQIRESVQDQVRAITQASVISMNQVSEQAGESKLKLAQMNEELKGARQQTAEAQREVSDLKARTGLADQDLSKFKEELEKLKATAQQVSQEEVTQMRELVKFLNENKEGADIARKQKENAEKLKELGTLAEQHAKSLADTSEALAVQRAMQDSHGIKLASFAVLQGQLDAISRGISEQERQKIIEQARKDLLAAQATAQAAAQAAQRAEAANRPKEPSANFGGGGKNK